MKWTLFVLDFDGTYGNEPEDEDGVQPLVYLVPKERTNDVSRCALRAHDDFIRDNTGMCIGDYFEEWLEDEQIDYRRVGDIDLTFGERFGDYLSKEIEIAVV